MDNQRRRISCQNLKKVEQCLFLAWATSFIAMLGSLYFSEIMEYVPCELCWYQRILMYPLVIILGISIIKREYTIARYSLALSMIGAIISIYHSNIFHLLGGVFQQSRTVLAFP